MERLQANQTYCKLIKPISEAEQAKGMPPHVRAECEQKRKQKTVLKYSFTHAESADPLGGKSRVVFLVSERMSSSPLPPQQGYLRTPDGGMGGGCYKQIWWPLHPS